MNLILADQDDGNIGKNRACNKAEKNNQTALNPGLCIQKNLTSICQLKTRAIMTT